MVKKITDTEMDKSLATGEMLQIFPKIVLGLCLWNQFLIKDTSMYKCVCKDYKYVYLVCMFKVYKYLYVSVYVCKAYKYVQVCM